MSFSKSTELTHTFIKFGNSPLAISEENIRLLELFMLYVQFGKNHRYTDINEGSYISFFKSLSPKLKGTVLLKDALLENIKQSVYQVGRLWRECFDNVVLPGPELWGWRSYSEL